MQGNAQALVVGLDGVTQANLRPIAEFATRQRLPSIYAEKAYAKVGRLIGYGASDVEMYHRAAVFVDKILKGARSGDLPVEEPNEFELVINVRTAAAIGLAIPQTPMMRANELIRERRAAARNVFNAECRLSPEDACPSPPRPRPTG